MTMILMMTMMAVDADALARDAVADLQARAFVRVTKRFDAKMREVLPPEKLAPVWSAVTAQFGAFKSIRSVQVQARDAMQLAQLSCAFEKSDVVITIAVDAEGKISSLFFKPAGPTASWAPPPYAREVDEREVTVGPAKLPGTLTLPKHGKAPFRAVIFVHGSGPNDRDETLGPNKLFKDLALGLAAKGIASLRYEKRTRFAPESFVTGVSYTVKEEVTDDVREAVSLLSSMKEIDAKRLVVLGHSLGGLLAPRIAVDDERVAGIAIFAGPTRQLDVLVREQLQVAAPGNAELAANAEAFSKRLNDPKLSPTELVDFLGSKLPGAYLLDLRAYDPLKTVAKVKQPIFIAQGARDYQVTLVDFEGWQTALKGRPNATLQTYAALNHQFLEGRGPSTPAEYSKPGHVPEVVIDELSTWVSGLQ